VKPVSRRHLLGAPLAAAALLSTPGALRAKEPEGRRPLRRLRPDPRGIVALPDGYSYRILQRAGTPMDDGFRVPGRPDAMACFEGPGETLVLMRNHEVFVDDWVNSPYSPERPPPAEAYDRRGTGGVSRVVLDAKSLKVKSSNLVLAGTYWNCAGGKSPWGWLSCEETVVPGHGFVFLCPTDAARAAKPQRIEGYGRMRHEAATIDPATSIAYLTEDRDDACFYRFVPDDRERPFEGRLQALRIPKQPRFETTRLRRGPGLAVDWVDVPLSAGEQDGLRYAAQDRGAALIRRGEGLWLDDSKTAGVLYFCATSGGPLGLGQVFRLDLAPGGKLEVIAESIDPGELDMPDNITVSPQGQLYIAEDGAGGNHIRRITLDGRTVDLAANTLSPGEFAGPCFAPDGKTLFVNMQSEGLTLAIRGPFDRELEQEQALRRAPEHPPLDWTRGGRGIGAGLGIMALAALAHRRRRLRRGEDAG